MLFVLVLLWHPSLLSRMPLELARGEPVCQCTQIWKRIGVEPGAAKSFACV